MVRWPADWLVGWLVAWSVDWLLVCWLVGCWLIGWLSSWMLLALVAEIACLHSDGFDNLLGSLAHELNSFVSLGTDRNTLLSLLTYTLTFFA